MEDPREVFHLFPLPILPGDFFYNHSLQGFWSFFLLVVHRFFLVSFSKWPALWGEKNIDMILVELILEPLREIRDVARRVVNELQLGG